jgi:hypothetical protein
MLNRVCAMVCAAVVLAGPMLAQADEPVVVPSPRRLVLGLQTSATVYRTGATGGRATRLGGGGGSGGWSDLAVAGAITLGVSYVSTVIGGQVAEKFMFDQVARDVGGEETIARLWIPVLGPWLALSHQKTVVEPECDLNFGGCDETQIRLSNSMILLGGLAQLSGTVMFVQGMRKGRKAAPANEGSRRVYSLAPLGGGGMFYVAGSF